MPPLDGPANSPPDSDPQTTPLTSSATQEESNSETAVTPAPDQPATELSWDPDAHGVNDITLDDATGIGSTGDGAIGNDGTGGNGSGSGGFGHSDSKADDPDGDSEPAEHGKMTFLDHLEELRSRIIHSIIAVVVGFFASWTYADEIYAALAWPITSVMRELNIPDQLVYTNPTAVFSLYVQLAFVAGLFLVSPYLLWQVWGFIAPGLYPRERHYAIPFIFLCTGLFLSGAAFAYRIAFPATLRFLLNFSKQFQAMITVNEYFSLAIMIILGLAIVFELPVLILFLTMLRVVTPGFLLRNFRYALLLIFFVAALITPTPDVPTMMLFAAPLTGLYFLGVGMSYVVIRLRRKREEES